MAHLIYLRGSCFRLDWVEFRVNSKRDKRQVRLAVFENEPLARLAEQRLREEDIPSVVRALGGGPGVYGVATHLPHALYIMADDQMRAYQVLDLPPAEMEDRDRTAFHSSNGPSILVIGLVIVGAAALLMGIVELLIKRVLD